MTRVMYRLTPRRTFTLNNRWYFNVKPKKSFFFFLFDKEEAEKWIYFLCREHKKEFLFLHKVQVTSVKFRSRTIHYKLRKNYVRMVEIIVPSDFTKTLVLQTVKVPAIRTTKKSYLVSKDNIGKRPLIWGED